MHNGDEKAGSLERGLKVLEVVRSSLFPLPLAQVAELAGLDPSTTLRCLKTLMRRGYVFRLENSKTYTVGRTVLTPAGQTEIVFNLRRDIHPHLMDLVARTQMTATLLLILGESRIALDVVTGKDRLVPYNSAEIEGPVHSTVSGKLLLLSMSQDRREALLRAKALQKFTATTTADPAEIIQQVTQAEAKGFVRTKDETTRGVFGLGAPLRSNSGKILAGLCLYCPTRMLNEDVEAAAIETLLESAALIEVTAGGLAEVERLTR